MGGYGYVGEYVVERLWRDAKLMEIGAGTNEAHQKNITRDIMKSGLPGRGARGSGRKQQILGTRARPSVSALSPSAPLHRGREPRRLQVGSLQS